MTQYSPYWWQDQPQYSNFDDIPTKADIVIVGAGYTGLSAALTLSQAGRSVVVLDAEVIALVVAFKALAASAFDKLAPAAIASINSDLFMLILS